MPIVVRCSSCGYDLYSGKELKSIDDVARRWDYRCPCCLSKLEKVTDKFTIRPIHELKTASRA